MRRYVQAFFRHPFLLTMPIVLAVAIGLGYQVRQPRSYNAAASMWCDVPVPNQSSIFSGTSELPSASQSVVLTELLATREFLSKVGQNGPWAGYLAAHPGADGDRLLFQLASQVSVSTPGPHVLAISTKGASPGDALALAKAVSDAYVAEVNDTQRSRAQSSVGFYKLQVGQAQTALTAAQDKLTKYLAANQGSGPLGALTDATVTQLTQAVSVAQSNYDLAASHLTDAGVGLSTVADSGVLRIFDAPRTTGLPVSRKKKLVFGGVAGIFAGALVSLFTLLFLVVGDRAVHGTGDVEDLLGMQVVGTIDQFKTKIRPGKSAS
jgi:uncharacterized protein involved in exopolysaccharide biosynthesis